MSQFSISTKRKGTPLLKPPRRKDNSMSFPNSVERVIGYINSVQFVKTDTTSWTAQVAGFKAAVSFSPSGTVDLVLASAGLTGENASSWLKKAMPSSSSGQDPSAPISPSIDVNLKAVYYTTHLAIYYFKKTLPEEKSVNLDKHLSFMSSAAGYIAMNNATDYNASKFGVRGLWKAIRHSNTILGHNATSRTNLIAPTWIATSMTEYMWSALRKSGIEIATVGDVVASVMRAACDEEISGRAICIGPGKNTPGDSNFDLCDDWNGLDAGRVLQEKIKDGTFGGMKG
jgi:5'-hydroxyaverantin dehydrogenase